MEDRPAAERFGSPRLKGALYILVLLLGMGWLFGAPPGLLGKGDAVGYAVCHRIAGRSFHLDDRPLPLCARCSGMFLGALLGLAYQARRAPRAGGLPSGRVVAGLVGLVAAFGFDGVNSYLHLFPGAPGVYEPNNTLRLLTGTGMGLAMAAFLYPAFNATVWQDYRNRPALGDWRALGGLFLWAALLDGLILTENPLILYPLALASAAAVPCLLALVYTMVGVMVLRWENRIVRLSQLALPLAGGVGLAILQIALIDLLRFYLTGTWDGFQLG